MDVGSRYQKLAKIGKGSFGDVYKGYDTGMVMEMEMSIDVDVDVDGERIGR